MDIVINKEIWWYTEESSDRQVNKVINREI